MSRNHSVNPEVIVLSFFICFFLFVVTWLISTSAPQQYSELAWSFIHGHTYLMNPIQSVDLVVKNGRTFWHLGPLPAILLIPIALAMHGPFGQPVLVAITNLLVFYSIYTLAWRQFIIRKINALWLAFMYLFASTYSIATYSSWSWYLAQGTATLFVLLSFLEFFSKRRYWLIGIFLGLTFLARFTAGLTVLFFVMIIISEGQNLKLILKKLLFLGLPIIFAGLVLLGYNFVRFNNPLDNGYNDTINQNSWVARKYGLFNPIYIPSNIFHYFIASFQPVYDQEKPPEGRPILLAPPYLKTTKNLSVSFFIASPLFILIFWSDWRQKYVKYAFINAGIILLLLLSYYYPGSPQVGPRYMNDLLPLLLIALLTYFQTHALNFKHKALIIASACLNFYIFLATFGFIKI